MKILSIAFLTVSILLIIIFVIVSVSFIGVAISEVGLWLSWIPLSFFIASIPLMIQFVNEPHPRGDFFMLLLSALFNLMTYIRLMIPFYVIRRTNIKFKKLMKESLGEEYLSYIDPSIKSTYFASAKFKLGYYFTGVRKKKLDEIVNSVEQLVYRTVDGVDLTLNVYYPKREGINPVIIFVHGGGWMSGSKDLASSIKVSKLLATYGYTVFNIDYRLTPTEAFTSWRRNPHDNPTIREMVSDVRTAIIYAKTHAEKYQGDPNYTFLFGRSAGAHLVLLTALSCDQKYFDLENVSCSIDDVKTVGVIAFYPITSMLDLYNSYSDGSPLRLSIFRSTGGAPEAISNLYELFSPVYYIDEDTAPIIPPIFLAAGKLDGLIEVQQSKRMSDALQKHNITNVFLELPWANHAFDLVLTGPGGQLIYDYLSQFLVWALTKKKLEEIDQIAEENGLDKMVSLEKVKLIHTLENKQEDKTFKEQIANHFNILNKQIDVSYEKEKTND